MVFSEVIERDQMTCCEDEDVDVISNRRAVFGIVVCSVLASARAMRRYTGLTITEHEQLLSLPDCNLC